MGVVDRGGRLQVPEASPKPNGRENLDDEEGILKPCQATNQRVLPAHGCESLRAAKRLSRHRENPPPQRSFHLPWVPLPTPPARLKSLDPWQCDDSVNIQRSSPSHIVALASLASRINLVYF